ncbi:MAG TPA: methyl-accepting chemotaxis protein [Spirochaetota bacterium]|nr:methyl-accepting chemotaxis protein [Spirochaetota bacterium]
MEKTYSFTSKLLKIFLFYYFIHPFLFFFTLIIAVGFESFTDIIKIISFLAPPIILLFTSLFYFYLKKKISDRNTDTVAGLSSDADRLPLAGFILLTSGCIAGPILSVITGYISGLFLSYEQCGFFLLIGLIQAFTAGGLFFFHLKVIIYKYAQSESGLSVTPLTLFQKLVIPICSSVILLIIFASAGVYRVSYKQTYEMYSSNVASRIGKNVIFAGSLFEKVVSQLNIIAQFDVVKKMNTAEIQQFLIKLHGKRGEDIEMFFTADAAGIAPTSIGNRPDISDRPYFKEIMATGKPVFTEPIISKATGNLIVVAAVPVFGSDNSVKGLAAATILLTRIQTLLGEDKFSETGRFMLITKEGKLIYHPDKTLAGKTIGKDIVNDGKNFRDIEKLITEKDNTFFSYTFNGKSTFSYKEIIPLTGQYLVYSMDRNEFVKNIRYLLIQIIAALGILSIILFFVIWHIAKRFSIPIQNTISIIQRLAEGDLTAESSDFIADEFGELLRNFKVFQRKLRGIISSALDAVLQMSSSAEELASTSGNMSSNAQNQAASVEEASASLEEISGAVEMISGNAMEQSEHAKNSFNSMEKLKRDNETVSEYARSALTTARDTTEQANNGRRLMSDAIKGMDNIDESTRRIAEKVQLISDISDQVNLLALNASIEAARAGEHGRGFAVVAEEISKLADQTASGAKSINEFVNEGLNEVNSGRSYVNATGLALDKIIGFISQTEELVSRITDSVERQGNSSLEVLNATKKVRDMSERISSATHEQMMTNHEIAKTVEQINYGTQSSAAAAEQIASSAEQISAQAETLRAQMQFFKV